MGSGATCLGPTPGPEQGQRLIPLTLRCQVNINAAFGNDEKLPTEQFKLLNSEETLRSWWVPCQPAAFVMSRAVPLC